MDVEVDADMVEEKLEEEEEEEVEEEEKEEEGDEENSSDKIERSNNPHLAGGEKERKQTNRNTQASDQDIPKCKPCGKNEKWWKTTNKIIVEKTTTKQ